MRNLLWIVVLMAVAGLLAGTPVAAQFDVDEGSELSLTRTAQTQPVSCEHFSVVVSQDCSTGGIRIYVLCGDGNAPYEAHLAGDSIFIQLFGKGVPRTPSSVKVYKDKDRLIRRFPLQVIFETDTARYDLIHCADSIGVEPIDSEDFLEIRSAASLPVGILPQYIVFSESAEKEEIRQSIVAIDKKLSGVGRCIVLPPGYYRCFADRIDQKMLTRRPLTSINLMAERKITFIELQHPDSRSQALQVISEFSKP